MQITSGATGSTADNIFEAITKVRSIGFFEPGLRVDTTTTDSDGWSNNRIAVRVEERLALAVYRPAAFCKVTDVPTTGS